jgi:hypothetical protein
VSISGPTTSGALFPSPLQPREPALRRIGRKDQRYAVLSAGRALAGRGDTSVTARERHEHENGANGQPTHGR